VQVGGFPAAVVEKRELQRDPLGRGSYISFLFSFFSSCLMHEA